jgi:hypothetical protein
MGNERESIDAEIICQYSCATDGCLRIVTSICHGRRSAPRVQQDHRRSRRILERLVEFVADQGIALEYDEEIAPALGMSYERTNLAQ